MNNEISIKRRKNLTKILNEYKIPFKYDKGVSKGSKRYKMYKHILNKMIYFKNSKFNYGIICDDDFYPCEDFWNKLMVTLKFIDKDFRCLHLCPGFLWGRKFNDKNKYGKLNNEKNIDEFKHNKYVFFNIEKKNGLKKKYGWVVQ